MLGDAALIGERYASRGPWWKAGSSIHVVDQLHIHDAFGAMPRRIRVGVRRSSCTDPALARRSADKLLEEQYTTVAFGHGPVLREDARERLRQVVAECRYGR